MAGLTYDPDMGGGCTVIETDRDGAQLNEYVGIAGTSTDCGAASRLEHLADLRGGQHPGRRGQPARRRPVPRHRIGTTYRSG
ncbi:hypothetical protein [Pseudonocardia humida]|uniref:Uncharacterized protein n=1 Tax=Pseudonocardia humida TaxID=2800819 RepID=A0ABT1A9X4_9PSEU|nr:hypothetical protein [Pseudonocardia humida]MCO1659751.1 hypothetical protein [Pseudonocardia humida]